MKDEKTLNEEFDRYHEYFFYWVDKDSPVYKFLKEKYKELAKVVSGSGEHDILLNQELDKAWDTCPKCWNCSPKPSKNSPTCDVCNGHKLIKKQGNN